MPRTIKYLAIVFLAYGPGCQQPSSETSAGRHPDQRDTRRSSRDKEENTPFLWPPNECVFKGQAAQMALLADGQAPAPVIRLDGQPIQPVEWLLAEDWNNTRRKPTQPDHSAAPRDEGRVTARPPLQAGQRVLFWTDKIPAGRHVLEADGQQVTFFVRGKITDKPPSDWPIFKPHPPAKQLDPANPCAACHVLKNGELGRAPEPQSCWTCHDERTFEEVHDHPLDPLNRCGMCHDPHGSTARRGLLKDNRQALCDRCH